MGIRGTVFRGQSWGGHVCGGLEEFMLVGVGFVSEGGDPAGPLLAVCVYVPHPFFFPFSPLLLSFPSLHFPPGALLPNFRLRRVL